MPHDNDFAALTALVDKWQARMKRAFHDAEQETHPIGKRLIEHGGMVYFNCAQDLKEALQLSKPTTSTSPSEPQT